MTLSETTQMPDVLRQDEAEARAARVNGCAYALEIDLHAGAPFYRGRVVITFDDAGGGDLFLDARGGPIGLLEVNGRALAPRKEGHRLTLPADALRETNRVVIEYENEYDHTGDGFHQFIDPEDGEEYLYTNFEPFEAHRLFPCFDQPDIKATYSLAVTAPEPWTIISNSAELRAEPQGDGRVRHTFKPTKPFSTYLFAIVAGPYHAFRAEHNGVALGFFCRGSLVKHFDGDELFTLTRQGLDFYAEFFDYPYPFEKYDQVFVPEFNSGAMENVGCVTHNEYMVFRDPPTENQRRGRAETLLHEMAHMWFGDLVTMRWWNDLWLNESFATYMSYLALTGATRFGPAGWQDFNASIKNWAYRQDQLVTTHPIAGQVASTDETFLNFDGITYGKGASVLKQLAAAIGIDGFREGMRRYMRSYEYGNASLHEFLGALSEGSGVDLREWSRLWLETSSLNTLAAGWEADGDRLTRLTVTQTAPVEHPTLRPHYLEVGLFRDDQGRPAVTSLPVRIAGSEVHVGEAQGLARPDLVLPNFNDHAYAKVALDAGSLEYMRRRLDAFDDLLTRQLLWSALWNMVRDQQLSSLEYLALAREKIVLEQSTELLDSVLQYSLSALSRYVPDPVRSEEYHAFFETARDVLRHGGVGGDARIVWARALVDSAANIQDIAYLAALADGVEVLPGLTLDQDMRWTIATKCVAYGLGDGEARVEAERGRDPSDRGQRALIFAEASAPDAEAKARTWARILGDGWGSLHLTGAAMSGFNWTHQRPLIEPYVDRYFDTLPAVFRDRAREFATSFARALFPRYIVEEPILRASERVLEVSGSENPLLERILREANDDHARAIRCRAFAAEKLDGERSPAAG